ncbi:MAG: hypothetical protein CVV34_02325 [Methanomicrobiales archaeon HGW-Methanomicrobiales-5]|nr:MAG: hypothetical protein CVV34_02325 [Methanomicrobiales archaeon HGW-Methanomicrobiales-5]
MEPLEKTPEKVQKIKVLEQELNDLRQGLTAVTDYYKDLKNTPEERVASQEIDEEILEPLVEDELEFEGIWGFHEEVLVIDPLSHVPCNAMYEAFVEFCTKNRRRAIEQEAFEFVFARMENPEPVCERGHWVGYRLRDIRQ